MDGRSRSTDGLVRFKPGQVMKTVGEEVFADDTVEFDARIGVRISWIGTENGLGPTVIGRWPILGTVTLVDDD
jgi:hypothetical protein